MTQSRLLFQGLLNKKINIFIDVKRNSKLSPNYVGFLESVNDDFIVVRKDDPKSVIETLIINIDIIVSVFVLKEQ